MKSKEIIQQKYKNVTCSNCNSNNVKNDGKRKTKNGGEIQRYKCKDCKLRFVLDDGFYRMRNHEMKITLKLEVPPNLEEKIESAIAKAIKNFEIDLEFAIVNAIASKSDLTEEQVRDLTIEFKKRVTEKHKV